MCGVEACENGKMITTLTCKTTWWIYPNINWFDWVVSENRLTYTCVILNIKAVICVGSNETKYTNNKLSVIHIVFFL